MKKTLMAAALTAATLAPTVAQAQDGWRNEAHREWREERRDDRRDWREDRREQRRDWREQRRDDRADWQRWRDSHRTQYRRGTWSAPFRYQRFHTGTVVPRSYWRPHYYVDNWGYYRLPRPAYGYYRYVRHYDDLLLINTRTGRVIRVYRDFYW